MAYIQYNPHEPGDRERAYLNFLLGFLVLCGSVGSIIYYICSLVSLMNGIYSENLLYSTGLIILMSIIDFFAVFSNIIGETKFESAKKYFLFFIGGILDLSATIGIVVAINSLCHTGKGVPLLVCSILGALLVTITVIILYRKIQGSEPIKLFTNKEILSKIKEETAFQSSASRQTTFVNTKPVAQNLFATNCFYCHKCGQKLPGDSSFCSFCGTKLK